MAKGYFRSAIQKHSNKTLSIGFAGFKFGKELVHRRATGLANALDHQAPIAALAAYNVSHFTRRTAFDTIRLHIPPYANRTLVLRTQPCYNNYPSRATRLSFKLGEYTVIFCSSFFTIRPVLEIESGTLSSDNVRPHD